MLGNFSYCNPAKLYLKIAAPDDYHEDYDTVVRKSQEEIRRGYRPRVKAWLHGNGIA